MKILFCGAAGSVTGSCFLVTIGKNKFLVDCGMFQGSKVLKTRNYDDFIFNPAEVDFVLLTHAHIDHSGLLPKLYKKGYKGKVYCTKATKELCAIVLPDSGYIQESEVERKNRKLGRSGQPLLEPIYTAEDAQACLPYIEGLAYENEFSPVEGIKVKLLDAGHIIGSAIIELRYVEEGNEKVMVFSGDLGNLNQPIVEDPTLIPHADVLVMESTYGNRYHLEAGNRIELLTEVIRDTYKKGGNLVIPSFAVERTQDLIYDLKILKEKGLLPPMEIYIDSPMAVAATQVFINNPQCFDEEASCLIKGEGAKALFEGSGIHYVLSAEESMALNKVKSGAIIISASGMADAGRIKHHLKHNLWRSESTVLFVGYQAEGTLGRRILEGEKKVVIHGEEIAVKANIKKIDGFSAHADQKGLLEWVRSFKEKPGKIFLVHGEEEALLTLERVLKTEFDSPVQIAEYAFEYDISKLTSYVPEKLRLTQKSIPKSSLNESFKSIKDKIQVLAGIPGNDMRAMQRALAQINEIEREINKASS